VVEWLVPAALFWSLAALYLGGGHVNIQGGSFQQLVGLLDTFVLYLIVWAVVRALVRGAVGVVPSVLIATAVASLLLPLLAKFGFRVLGVRLSKAKAAH
jgi:hypothetical protein